MEQNNQHINPTELLPKYLAGELTPSEKLKVEDWLSADAANSKELDALARVWDITSRAPAGELIDIDAEWKKIESTLWPAASKTINLRRFLQMAAMVVLVSALAFFGFRISDTKTGKAPATAMSVFTLPDGSKVSVNAGSKITYRRDFGKTNRQISLRGEAYFEVVRNTRLPFTVMAGEAGIRVRGTKFNVKAYKNQAEIKVSVNEGSVQLYDSRQPLKEIILHAGETGTYDKTMKTVKKQPVLDMNDIAWKTRVIDLSNTPLPEVAALLQQTYHREVIVSPGLQNCTITVRFENLDLDSVLEVLQSTLDLTFTTEGKTIVIRGRGC